MPEIAEVHVVCGQLQALTGDRIVRVDVRDERLAGLAGERLQGRTVTGVRRHGKLIGLDLDDGRVLAVHLRMTGAVMFAERPHTRLAVMFGSGRQLVFSDPRKFGTVEVTTPQRFPGRQGPDLFDDPEGVEKAAGLAARSRRAVKAVLLDQTVVAGLGNWMADELLGRCRVAPQQPACELSEDMWRRLYAHARELAREAVAHGGVSMRDYRHPDGGLGSMQTRLRFYGQAGRPCPHCATPLAKASVAGRGSTYCPACQSVGSSRR